MSFWANFSWYLLTFLLDLVPKKGPCPLEVRNCYKHKQIADFSGTFLFPRLALPAPLAFLGYVVRDKTALNRAKNPAFLLSRAGRV